MYIKTPTKVLYEFNRVRHDKRVQCCEIDKFVTKKYSRDRQLTSISLILWMKMTRITSYITK